MGQGTLLLAVEFVLRHPRCLFDITLLSLVRNHSKRGKKGQKRGGKEGEKGKGGKGIRGEKEKGGWSDGNKGGRASRRMRG